MVAVTPTWEIPYAEDTDQLCDGCTITESMAERIDDILTEFDVSLAASAVVPLARASRSENQANPVSGDYPYTAIDFDTTGIADLNQPSFPILVTEDYRWLAGGYILWDSDATSGNEGLSLNSALGSSPMAYMYRQRVAATAGDDQLGQYAGPFELSSIFTQDRLSTAFGVFSNIYHAFFWVWRVGPKP